MSCVRGFAICVGDKILAKISANEKRADFLKACRIGNLVMAFVFSGSTLIPCLLTTYPSMGKDVSKNLLL